MSSCLLGVQPGLLVAVSVMNWLRGASIGIDVDTDVAVLNDLNVIRSTPVSLQGMEVDDADFHRRNRGEGYTGGSGQLFRSRVRFGVPSEVAQGLTGVVRAGTDSFGVADGEDDEADGDGEEGEHDTET